MSALHFGPAGNVPAGYARVMAGTVLLRGHSSDKAPNWFSPAVDAAGRGRFDLPVRFHDDPGVCYLAPKLEGVLLERVIRDVVRSPMSRRTLAREHAITQVRLTRDLMCFELLSAAWTAHGVQMSVLTALPPYEATQGLARKLVSTTGLLPNGDPLVADGIAYGSRFGAAHECLAIWDRAADALTWGATRPLGDDPQELTRACEQLGIELID